MVLNATFNNISVISWWSVLLVGETREPVTSHWQTWSHNVVHLAWAWFELTTLVVVGTDCIGSCESNYHMITATTAPERWAFCQKNKSIQIWWKLRLFFFAKTYTTYLNHEFIFGNWYKCCVVFEMCNILGGCCGKNTMLLLKCQCCGKKYNVAFEITLV